MNRKTVSVLGMACTGCEQNVENALKQLDDVTRAEADHEGDAVEVVVGDDLDEAELHGAIEQAGYDVQA
ncbi:MAG: heavy-metal-associated domain-containing protein [Halobacteriales archaeon]